MKNITFTIVILIATIPVYGQIKVSQNHSSQNLTCNTCHNCEVPTKQSPCLSTCPRLKDIAENSPTVVVLDKIENIYLPVSFSHRIHAQMSKMSGGCASCHHYNKVESIQKCDSCHELEIKPDDINKPSLKRAYHMQCMDCHRKWSHENGCNSCHIRKKDLKVENKESIQKKYSGKDHPVILEPTKLVYETKSDKGKFVTFYHDDHTKKFGLTCTTCHKQESCIKCHDLNKVSNDKPKSVTTKKTFEDQHKNCSSCHNTTDNTKCVTCHSARELKPFNHLSRTGFELKSYHAKLSCQKCHQSKQVFTGLNRSCQSCHSVWNSSNFNHKVTGLILDETHSEFDCGDCHSNEDYSKKPTCDSCHDDMSYPVNKPGKLAK